MNLRFLISFLFLLPTYGATDITPAMIDDFDRQVERIMGQWNIPGAAVAIVKGGEVVNLKGYGVRTVGAPGKVDADTVFAIASITKPFTAAALGMLVSEGKLAWDGLCSAVTARKSSNMAVRAMA